MVPPSLGARVFARFIDGLVIGVTMTVIAALVDLGTGTRAVLATALAITYDTVAVAVYGRTVGKRACGARVVSADDQTLTWARSLARATVLLLPIYLISPKIDTFAEWSVVLFLVANFVVVARRRDDRRGIHDVFATTRPIAVLPVEA